jgi:hypothetical protein
LAYPRYIAGENPASPEDCGGIPGFYAQLEALADPNHLDHEDAKEWFGASIPTASTSNSSKTASPASQIAAEKLQPKTNSGASLRLRISAAMAGVRLLPSRLFEPSEGIPPIQATLKQAPETQGTHHQRGIRQRHQGSIRRRRSSM